MGRETTGFSYKNNKQLYELADMVGVNSDDFYGDDDGSQPEFDRDGFSDAIENAWSNDYSTRRALEAANLAGEKDVPKSIGSIEDAYNAHKWMKAQHEGGGKYSSNQDRANITQKWVEEDREQLQEKFSNDLNAMKESLLDQALSRKTEEEEEDYEPSEKLGGALDRLETAAHSPTDLYIRNNETAPRTDDQKDGTKNFFDAAKLDLATGMNLQNDVFNNLTNAANQVTTNIYGR